ncbi:MAG: hypothetical protein RIS17_17 [Pseudomonadota bacterium]
MGLLNTMLAVIERTAAAIDPRADAAIKLGHAVVDLAKDVRQQLDSAGQASLDAALPALLAKMNEDVDAAIRTLRGE